MSHAKDGRARMLIPLFVHHFNPPETKTDNSLQRYSTPTALTFDLF
ncbi:MAG: hypothetical protein ISR82_01425 [Candidatus Marinimicrobia bacterium]|nr:hypothetical protein [Candidatus Neomarinimicrobiota bacterium]MBL7009867.1 hypothetical protein [Candidatus Neomarinimicrobiota bacterium]MBL7030182.1 hypothetical protein [Candidatus Neomarinimicrobiota bacterium]